jgi:hypothetical protein
MFLRNACPSLNWPYSPPLSSETQGGMHEVCYPWDCMLLQMYEARKSLPTELTIYNSQFGADISGRHSPPPPPPPPQSLCKLKAIPQTAKTYDPWKLSHGRKQNQFCSRWYRYIFIPPSTHYLLFYERRSFESWDETKPRSENILRGQLQQLESFGHIPLAKVLTRRYCDIPDPLRLEHSHDLVLLFPQTRHWDQATKLEFGSAIVKALCYKPESCGFETRWGEWIFSIYLILPAALDSGVYSPSNRNRKIIFLRSRWRTERRTFRRMWADCLEPRL